MAESKLCSKCDHRMVCKIRPVSAEIGCGSFSGWISVYDWMPEDRKLCDFVVELSGDRQILRGFCTHAESDSGVKWQGFCCHHYSFCTFGNRRIFASTIISVPEEAFVTHWRAVDDELPERFKLKAELEIAK